VRFLAAAHARLRPGAPILLETINVACWVAFFESYVRDITHVRPLHPDTLEYLVVAAGFEDVDVHFRSPVEPAGRLQRIPEEGLPPALTAAVRTLNGNVDRLNERMFTYLDYAVIGVRGR
jgi:O-antigen chain-terminating methyltransferase